MRFATILATTFSAATFAVVAQDVTIISANATLKDGSTVKGEFTSKSITGSTIFMEKLELDPTIVKSLTFAGTNGESKIELTNGDKFAMTVANESFALKSLLGELNIPRNNFRLLALSVHKCAKNGAEDGLIFYCTFDDEAAVATPTVGPSMKLELGQLKANAGKNGGALFVNPGIAGAVVQLPQGTLGVEGCIEFWANMASGKTEFTTGGDPNYFAIYTDDGNPGGALGFASNDGVGNSGLCGFFFGMRAYSNPGYTHMMPYSDVFKGEDYNGWHHYAFTWTQTSLSFYIDGKRVAHSTGHLNTALLARGDITLAIPLHRTLGKSFNNKSAFLMDEFKIWNYAKTTFDL